MFLITPMRSQKQYWYSVRQDIDHSYVMFYYPNSKSISTKELQKGGSVEFGYRPLQNYDICMTMRKTKNELCMPYKIVVICQNITFSIDVDNCWKLLCFMGRTN